MQYRSNNNYPKKWHEPAVGRMAKPTMSPVDGVELLHGGKHTNFLSVKSQLTDKLQESYGELCSFMVTGELWYPEEPDEAEIAARYPNINARTRESIFSAAVINYDKLVMKTNSDYAKIYGTVKRVLDPIVKDRIERSPDYEDAKDTNNPNKLWKLVVWAVGMQVAILDQEDAGHTVKLLYQAEKMTTHDTLLAFYHRLKLMYDNCVLLKVKDIPDSRE